MARAHSDAPKVVRLDNPNDDAQRLPRGVAPFISAIPVAGCSSPASSHSRGGVFHSELSFGVVHSWSDDRGAELACIGEPRGGIRGGRAHKERIDPLAIS